MKTTRIDWIDRMKAVCILVVMLVHLEAGQALPRRLYEPFFLNGFLFASGYVYRQEAFTSFFRKKVRTLLVPWLVFSVGNLALSQLFSFQSHGNFWTELGWNLLQIRGRGDGVWFVAALFVSFFPFYALMGWQERHKKAGWLPALAAILWGLGLLYEAGGNPPLPWHLEYVPQAVFFMVLGHLCRERKFSLWWTAAFGLLLLWGKTPEPVNGIVGTLVLAGLCQKLPDSRFLSAIGQNTLVCFALHGKVMSLLEWSLGHIGWYTAVLENPLLSVLLAVVLTAGMALILMIPAEIINRWLPWLLGRERRNKS